MTAIEMQIAYHMASAAEFTALEQAARRRAMRNGRYPDRSTAARNMRAAAEIHRRAAETLREVGAADR